MLQQTEVVARTRQQLADDLATAIVDVLKTIANRKEDARKKVVKLNQLMRTCYKQLSEVTNMHCCKACCILSKTQVRSR